jgi:hypothetical protein
MVIDIPVTRKSQGRNPHSTEYAEIRFLAQYADALSNLLSSLNGCAIPFEDQWQGRPCVRLQEWEGERHANQDGFLAG